MDPSKRVCLKNLPPDCTKREIADFVRRRTGAQPHSMDLGLDSTGRVRRYAHFSVEGAKGVVAALTGVIFQRSHHNNNDNNNNKEEEEEEEEAGPVLALPARPHYTFKLAEVKRQREKLEAEEKAALEAFWHKRTAKWLERTGGELRTLRNKNIKIIKDDDENENENKEYKDGKDNETANANTNADEGAVVAAQTKPIITIKSFYATKQRYGSIAAEIAKKMREAYFSRQQSVGGQRQHYWNTEQGVKEGNIEENNNNNNNNNNNQQQQRSGAVGTNENSAVNDDSGRPQRVMGRNVKGSQHYKHPRGKSVGPVKNSKKPKTEAKIPPPEEPKQPVGPTKEERKLSGLQAKLAALRAKMK